MSSKRPASGSVESNAIKMARPEQPAASARAARSASRAKTTPNNNSNVEAGSKETLALPIVPPEITPPPLKEEAAVGKVSVKKLQKRKGARVWTTKGELFAAGISDAQKKTIPAKASRGYMLYGIIVGRDAKGLIVEFDLFPAAEKTFTVGNVKRLRVVTKGTEEPTMSERERKKIEVCFSRAINPI